MQKIENPYAELTGGQWLKGNLHAHTSKSDGARAHQVVIDDYAGRHYDFLMISDHDVYASGEDLSRYDARGMVLVPGNEITANGPHLLHVGADRPVPPSRQRQQVILDILAADAAARGRGEPGSFAIVNHPNWLCWHENPESATLEQLREWIGYAGIEIYNGTIGGLNGSSYATDKWDMLLAAGRRLWGFANDDSHHPTEDVGLGWNMVYARTKTLPDIMDALRHGRFYASTGVVISNIQIEGTTVRIETENAERIVALQEIGKRFAQSDSNTIEVEIPPEAGYVRFECWGKGERFAWTQPLFISGQ